MEMTENDDRMMNGHDDGMMFELKKVEMARMMMMVDVLEKEMIETVGQVT